MLIQYLTENGNERKSRAIKVTSKNGTEYFKSSSDVQRKYRITITTIKKYSDLNKVYKGLLFEKISEYEYLTKTNQL